MGKNIVILNGSPRKNGNTSALVQKFTQGARQAGHTVSEFFLSDMKINGCKGCFGGHSSRPCPCVQKDDMDRIYPAIRTCDVVVLASPLYYWNFSGQLRTAMDRLFALEENDGNLLRGHNRACTLLMAAEGHGFGDVLTYYEAPALDRSGPCSGRQQYGCGRHCRKAGTGASLCLGKFHCITSSHKAGADCSGLVIYFLRNSSNSSFLS